MTTTPVTRTIAVVSAGLSNPSSTRLLADRLAAATVAALRGTPVLLAATAGTARHSLVVEFALRPLFAYLQAVPVPTGVFAATEDWAGGGSTALADRVDRAAGELADTLTGRPAAPRPVDPFADPTTSFEELLRGR